MRLIIKEYIAQLKEKDELDILISGIFEQKGYVADSQPKTGNRQYGVDIQLHNDSELLLFVVKQGDIDRVVWDGSINAVRPSLDEIKDVMINSLTYEEKKKGIRIIVATNGNKDEAIKLNWNNYVNNNQMWNGIPIKIEFMGIDDIVMEVKENYFNEYLFDSSMHSFMRKALYFIDDGDYKKTYFEQIVDSIIIKIREAGKNKKKVNKACATLYMASQMICAYAANEGIIKVSIDISEYVIIKFWKYFLEEELFEKQQQVGWLIKFCKSYEHWNKLYLEKIERIVNQHSVLPNYNVVENRVLLYEVLSYLASYGNYLLNVDSKRAKRVLNAIVGLINEYQYFAYAPYDVSINVVIMIQKLLVYFGRKNEAVSLLQMQVETMMYHYKWNKKFPAPNDNFEEALEIENNVGRVKYDSSAFWGYCLLIIATLDCKEIYDNIRDFLVQDLEKTTKCVWFMRREEELLFYDYYAMNIAGEGVELTLENNYDKFKANVDFVIEQYKDEIFSFEDYSFSSLEIILCHYYNYIPRVNFLEGEVN